VRGRVTFGVCRLRDDLCREKHACWLIYTCEKEQCSYLLEDERSLGSLKSREPSALWCVEFARDDMESFGFCRLKDRGKLWLWFECESPDWCRFSYTTSEKSVLYEFLKEVMLEITDWYKRELVKPFLKALAYG